MQKIIFTEEFCQPENLYPFTRTRQIQDIRVGILTIREKWEKWLGLTSFDLKESDYKDLSRSVDAATAATDGDCIMLHGNVLPTPELVKAVKKLKNGEFLSHNGESAIAYRFGKHDIEDTHKVKVSKSILFDGDIKTIHYAWDIIQLNDWAIRADFALLTKGRKSRAISRTNQVIGKDQVFVEKGARVEYSILNASGGPIYIGRDAEIMEGSMIRGPFSLGENAVVKMGAKIYPATTIGPHSIAAGEIKNSIISGYSNKAHDGYLGDSVVGEWCNLGAGTTNSNLKNNAGEVRMWTPRGVVVAGRKCGVMMGDYTRTAINTSINTGSVFGVGSNVFSNGLTPKYIPDFSWGSDGIERYQLERMLADVDAWKNLKRQRITEEERIILTHIFTH